MDERGSSQVPDKGLRGTGQGRGSKQTSYDRQVSREGDEEDVLRETPVWVSTLEWE